MRRKTFLIILALIVIVIAPTIWAAYLRFVKGYGWADWKGFGEYITPSVDPNQEYFRKKTLWDILELLIVPIILGIAAFLFNRSERKNDQDIAIDRQREANLQAYFNKMTELLLEKGLRESLEQSEVRSVARSRTLATLRTLDGTRKALLLRFLYETDLIDQNRVINLNSADLGGADLFGANLGGADLTGAYLVGAHLSGAALSMADLSGADLSMADLSLADLSGAKLQNAIVTEKQLASARSLEGAIMPDGNKRQESVKRTTESESAEPSNDS